jgi:hypothetical protein
MPFVAIVLNTDSLTTMIQTEIYQITDMQLEAIREILRQLSRENTQTYNNNEEKSTHD